jgi:S1-C subfamily serine protease
MLWPMRTRALLQAAAVALAAILSGGCALIGASTTELPAFPPPGKPPVVQDRPLGTLDLAGLAPDEQVGATIYHQYTRAVVNVTSFYTRKRLLGGQEVGQGTGSGSIMDQKGHVLTNFHVVRGAAAVYVTLYDGSAYPAQVVGIDDENDIAVLGFEPGGRRLTTIKLGSGRVIVGQRVYALGNPFGLEHTLTTGIVSAVGRPMTTEDGYMMKDLVQTDAAINPGNSGGPLLNSSGEMIGINTMILSPAGGSIGIGFAVPVTTALRVVPDLLEHGRVIRGWIDIVPVPIFPILERLGGLPTSRGIIVSQVKPGSPASAAGLRPGSRAITLGFWSHTIYVGGDIIVEINGEPVATLGEYLGALEGSKPGGTIELTLLRAQEKVKVKVPLTERPALEE